MKVECELCGKEDRGRLGKLLERNWLIIFIDKGAKIVRCEKCKPKLWERKDLFEEFSSEIEEAIRMKVEKIRILNSLKE